MIMQQDQDMENAGVFDGDIPQEEEDHKIDVTSEEMDEEEASMQI